MRICAAQTRSIKGDIQGNIANHKRLLDLAISNGADLIIFPELSLTGYEPALAKELATSLDDSRFDDFQKISDANQMTIGVGVPTKSPAGICISMILFQPHQARLTYSKKYIHADEEAFFVSGQGIAGLKFKQTNVALAICYELSIHEHAENAFRNRAKIYFASVAKFINGIDKAMNRLSEIAKKYSMTVLMSNCIGQADGCECAGKTSIWNNRGVLLGQLNDKNEGVLIIDTDTQKVFEKTISNG